MAYAKLRPRRGTKTEWELSDPILYEGELGIEFPDSGIGTGRCKFKIGDGYAKWTELEYAFDAEAADAIYGGTVTTHNNIWVRRGTTTEWKAENPVLGPGEIVYDETAHAIKVGNGESAFTDLQYIGYTWDVDGEWDFGNINQGIDPPGPDDEIYDFGNINLIEN